MSDRRESDGLLELAELQLERVASVRRRLFVLWVLVVLAVPVIVVTTWGAVTARVLEFSFIYSALATLVGVLMIFLVFLLRETVDSRRVEESVLNEALSLVQESEKYFADKEQWTLLERAEFRLRLRRLPVGVAPPSAPSSATASPTPTPAPSPTRPPTTV